jgi:putative addiction module CopG family antidote
MRTTRQFSITLTNEMAEMVRAKVLSGEYASESEVLRDGLRALQVHERALDTWLRDQVAPTYDAMKANPARGISAKKVLASLATARKASLGSQCDPVSHIRSLRIRTADPSTRCARSG